MITVLVMGRPSASTRAMACSAKAVECSSLQGASTWLAQVRRAFTRAFRKFRSSSLSACGRDERRWWTDLAAAGEHHLQLHLLQLRRGALPAEQREGARRRRHRGQHVLVVGHQHHAQRLQLPEALHPRPP